MKWVFVGVNFYFHIYFNLNFLYPTDLNFIAGDGKVRERANGSYREVVRKYQTQCAATERATGSGRHAKKGNTNLFGYMMLYLFMI